MSWVSQARLQDAITAVLDEHQLFSAPYASVGRAHHLMQEYVDPGTPWRWACSCDGLAWVATRHEANLHVAGALAQAIEASRGAAERRADIDACDEDD